MIQLMFTILLLIFFVGTGIYAFYYNKKYKKHILLLSALIILSLILVNWLDWRYSTISFLLLFIPVFFRKKIPYTAFISYSMLGAILCAFFLLNLYLNYDIQTIRILVFIGILSVVLICVLAIFGIFENSFKKYLIYSNFVQLTFVFLHLSVAKLIPNILIHGVIQIFNYGFAGVLLFITLGILIKENKYKKYKQISDLQGLYYKDRSTSICAIIAAVSLAGVPGLNIFVGKWLLLKISFGINPVITILGIFAALLLFVMYFKIVYILLSGEVLKRERSPAVLKVYNYILAFACLIFGLLPFTQFYILERIV